MVARALKRFPQIDPIELSHPLDAAALRNLQTFKGLDFICKKVLEYGAERIVHIENIGNRMRVSPRQAPELHEMVKTACSVLDVPEVELYIELDAAPNQWSYGVSSPFMVMTTGLLDRLEPDEVLAAIGHEVGHILSRHVLYRIVALNIKNITSIIGQATLGIGQLISQGLVAALLEWYRKSELSADRAGLLVCQDVSVMISWMAKLAGGSSRYTTPVDTQAFLDQAAEYDAPDQSTLDKIYKFLQEVDLRHPIPVVRAREIDAWSRSGDHLRVLAGNYDRRPKSRPFCGHCKRTVADRDRFCPGCGAALPAIELPPAERPAAACPSCQAALTGDPVDCPVCGAHL